MSIYTFWLDRLSSRSWHMDHPQLQGWWQTTTSLSFPHAVPAPHSRYPVVRLRDKLISQDKKDRSARRTCSHRWQKAGFC